MLKSWFPSCCALTERLYVFRSAVGCVLEAWEAFERLGSRFDLYGGLAIDIVDKCRRAQVLRRKFMRAHQPQRCPCRHLLRMKQKRQRDCKGKRRSFSSKSSRLSPTTPFHSRGTSIGLLGRSQGEWGAVEWWSS